MSIKNVSGPVIIVQSKIVRVQSHENAMIACWLLSRRGGAVACLLAYLDVSKLWPPNFLSDLSPLASYTLCCWLDLVIALQSSKQSVNYNQKVSLYLQ